VEINGNTKLDVLLKKYPFLVDFLAGLAPEFKRLRNPIMRKTMGKIATLDRVAAMGNFKLDELMKLIVDEVKEKASEDLVCVVDDSSSEVLDPEERKEILKEIIKGVHDGEDMGVLKGKFRMLIKDVDPSEISKMEQTLIDEGMPETEVKRLCDVHVEIFKEALEKHEIPEAPPGHPVHTFMQENRAAEEIMDEIEGMLKRIGDPPDENIFKDVMTGIQRQLENLAKIDSHYVRKENQLFPMLEAHDISGPSQVMWGIHDDIRALLKKASEGLTQSEPTTIVKILKELIPTTREMIYKEEHILFPMSLEQLTQSEWKKVRSGEGEIGYSWVKPEGIWPSGTIPDDVELESEKVTDPDQKKVILNQGGLTREQVNLMLTHLPVDITFVDEDDRVGYYSAGKERIFPRSPAIIGRHVQNCHPPRSVHIVEKILQEFKSGNRDSSEFWLQLDGKFIHIRYFAVRDSEGNYKGTMEVSQDLTEIKKLEGEKRLLDWE
jgi:PAS domain S-box-containing protein